MRVHIIILSAFFLSFCVDVNALSCDELNDRIIAQCTGKTCSEIFYVSEINAFGVCSRRTKISETPNWAKKVIEFELQQSKHSKETAIYELNLTNSYWNKSFLFEGADEYIRNRTEFEMPLSNFGELDLSDHSSMAAVKAQWESIESKELIIDVAWNVVNWLSLIVSFIFLVLSIIWFNQWIMGNRSTKWVIISLFGQLLILGMVMLSMMSWGYYLIMFSGLFVPGIWMYQLVFYVSNRLRSRALNKGLNLTPSGAN